MANLDTAIFSSWLFWLGLAIIPFVALIVDIVVKLITRTCFKSLADKIIELELSREIRGPQQGDTVGDRAKALLNNLYQPDNMAKGGQARNGRKGANIQRSQRTGGKMADGAASPIPDAQLDAAHGYSFTQAEGNPTGPLSQANVIRMYNTKMKKQN